MWYNRSIRSKVMKVGDLVRLDPELYRREKGYVGLLLHLTPVTGKWMVMIKDRVHPYYIDEEDMEVVNESR